jgi:hypothetical protein
VLGTGGVGGTEGVAMDKSTVMVAGVRCTPCVVRGERVQNESTETLDQ